MRSLRIAFGISFSGAETIQRKVFRSSFSKLKGLDFSGFCIKYQNNHLLLLLHTTIASTKKIMPRLADKEIQRRELWALFVTHGSKYGWRHPETRRLLMLHEGFTEERYMHPIGDCSCGERL